MDDWICDDRFDMSKFIETVSSMTDEEYEAYKEKIKKDISKE